MFRFPAGPVFGPSGCDYYLLAMFRKQRWETKFLKVETPSKQEKKAHVQKYFISHLIKMKQKELFEGVY
jgi:hypothetical protein